MVKAFNCQIVYTALNHVSQTRVSKYNLKFSRKNFIIKDTFVVMV